MRLDQAKLPLRRVARSTRAGIPITMEHRPESVRHIAAPEVGKRIVSAATALIIHRQGDDQAILRCDMPRRIPLKAPLDGALNQETEPLIELA